MSNSFTFGVAPEAEVLTFKQRGGESLKDAWYRISDSQQRSTKKQSTTVLLRNFYVGITSWNRFILDTSIGGNFLEAHTLEALNVIEILVGAPPIVDTNTEITLGHIMERLDKIENSMQGMSKINEIDKRIRGSVSRIDSSIKNVNRTLGSLRAKDKNPARVDKIEEIIDVEGTTLSPMQTKKVETPVGKGPKFVYMPKIPQPKFDTPTTKGGETLKTMEKGLL